MMSKWKNILLYSSITLIVATIIVPIINYFIGENTITGYLELKYIIHLITANNTVTMSEISQAINTTIIIKDAIVILTTTWFQLLAIITLIILHKRAKGFINYLLLLIFHIFSYSGIILNLYFLNNININFTFVTIETYALLALIIVNSIIFIIFSYKFIKMRLQAIKPITEVTIQNAIYYMIKVIAILLIISSITIFISGNILYLIATTIIDTIRIEDILNIHNTIRIDILNSFETAPKEIEQILGAIKYSNGIIELLNGEILIHVNKISNEIQIFLTTNAKEYFNYFTTIVSKYLGYFIIIQIFNYIHKKLNYKNIIPLLILLITVIIGILNLEAFTNTILGTINAITIGLVVLYIFIYIDYKVSDYYVTNIICNALNNFTISEDLITLINSFKEKVVEIKNKVQDKFKEFKKKK